MSQPTPNGFKTCRMCVPVNLLLSITVPESMPDDEVKNATAEFVMAHLDDVEGMDLTIGQGNYADGRISPQCEWKDGRLVLDASGIEVQDEAEAEEIDVLRVVTEKLCENKP